MSSCDCGEDSSARIERGSQARGSNARVGQEGQARGSNARVKRERESGARVGREGGLYGRNRGVKKSTGCDDRVRGLWATAESDDCVWCVLGVREFEVYINARESSRNGDTTTGDDVKRQC